MFLCGIVRIYFFMLQFISTSFPAIFARTLHEETTECRHASFREFFRHFKYRWAEWKLWRDIQISEREFKAGKGKILRSLEDLD